MLYRRPFKRVENQTTGPKPLPLHTSLRFGLQTLESAVPRPEKDEARGRKSGKKPKRTPKVSRRDRCIKGSQSHKVKESLDEATRKMSIALDHGLAPSTKRNYNNAVKRYLKFAASIGIEEDEALPCSRKALTLFLCNGLGKTGPGSAKASLSAIRSWHIDNGYKWTELEAFPRICRALAEFWPKNQDPKQDIRQPVTTVMLHELVRHWAGGSPKQLAALAIAIAAFCGQFRLGELIPESKEAVDAIRLPKRCDWIPDATNDRQRIVSSEIRLPWTKTTRFKGATVILVEQKDPLNASKAIGNHLATSSLPATALLCEYTSARGTRKFMDKKDFIGMCDEIWSACGFKRCTGHSFRIGGTTALLCSGVQPEIVKKMGRWSSDSFLLYWRNLKTIFTDSASNISWKDV